MASKLDKLNTSIPRKKTLYPPERLHERHEVLKRSGRVTLEAQRLDPSSMVENHVNFRMTADPEFIRRESPLFSPGRGKPAGGRRLMRFRKPPYD